VLLTPLDGEGGRLLVRADGARTGSTGSRERDERAASLAANALRDGAGATGVSEAGGERWLVQLLAPVRTVLVVGATEISAALCAIAAPLGWRTILIDPRDALLAEPRFAAATQRLASLPAEAVAAHIGTAGAAVVVVAHDYKVELPVLRIALRSEAAYVGMLGSRKRAAAMRDMLAEDGLGERELSRLRTPIGLAIGAQGAAEIAVSIVAELIAVWRGADPGVRPPAP
jgi:xanthine dehydrogenase accessory factor